MSQAQTKYVVTVMLCSLCCVPSLLYMHENIMNYEFGASSDPQQNPPTFFEHIWRFWTRSRPGHKLSLKLKIPFPKILEQVPLTLI